MEEEGKIPISTKLYRKKHNNNFEKEKRTAGILTWIVLDPQIKKELTCWEC